MELFAHQKRIIDDNPIKCGFWLGTGSGKSRIMAELAEGRTIVLSPKQQKVDRNFEKAVERFGIILNVETYSKEQFKKNWDQIGECKTLCIDECDEFLGIGTTTVKRGDRRVPKTSQIFEAVYQYIQKYQPKRIYLASATPAPKPLAVWGIAKLLGRSEVLGVFSEYYQFRDRFYVEKKMGAFKVWIDKKDKASKLLLASFLKEMGYVGRLQDWFDVPEQVHKEIYVGLTLDQKKAMARIEELESDPMVKRAKYRTIENGILYDQEVTVLSEREHMMTKSTKDFESEKTDHILRYAREFKRILIFANYTGQIDFISKILELQGYKVMKLTGSTKKEDRETLFATAEKNDMIIVAQSSISSGYEWKTCDCVIFASKSRRYVKYLQALGRPLRADALKKNLFIHMIVKGGLDESCHIDIMSGADFNEKIYE